MTRKRIQLAIAYDFDGTLAPGNMQEYDFVPAIGMTKKRFWKEVNDLTRTHNADNILAYMMHMLDKARAAGVKVRREDFEAFGRSVTLFEGVEGWFDRIDAYGHTRGFEVKHYIISSGIREMIEGTAIAERFSAIYASAFIYDLYGMAKWPALAVNYTTKTQFLFRINKGVQQVYDNTRINAFIPKEDRPVPFEHMVFIGDGETDIPCFRLVKDQGGHAVAVYKPATPGARTRARQLITEGRVNFIAPADYRENRALDKFVKGVIDKTAADKTLKQMGKKQ